MRVLEPGTVTILPTNTCTAQCRHCSMNSGPDRQDSLSGEQLEDIIDQLARATATKVIVFSGGESTLLGEDLNRALRRCRRHGIVSRLVTNAYWATSPEAALAKLRELREAGLDELNISTDDYHLPYISLQKIKTAYQAALQLDFRTIVICNAYGPESWLTPERLNAEFGDGKDMKLRYDADGQSIHHEYREGETLVMLSNGIAMQLGRGVGGLAESEIVHNGTGAGWDALHKLADHVGGCPWAVRSAAISPKGHLLSCCGTEVDGNPILDYGSLKDHSLEELLDFADGDLITNMIAFLGPVRIKQVLEQIAPGETIFPRTSYRGVCEVCEDLVKIEQNRAALEKYQEHFVEAVMAIREMYKDNFTVDGKVRVPAALNLVFNVEIKKPGIEPVVLGGLVTEPAAPAGARVGVGPARKVMLPVVP
jgi:hypothetical protein